MSAAYYNEVFIFGYSLGVSNGLVFLAGLGKDDSGLEKDDSRIGDEDTGVGGKDTGKGKSHAGEGRGSRDCKTGKTIH